MKGIKIMSIVALVLIAVTLGFVIYSHFKRNANGGSGIQAMPLAHQSPDHLIDDVIVE